MSIKLTSELLNGTFPVELTHLNCEADVVKAGWPNLSAFIVEGSKLYQSHNWNKALNVHVYEAGVKSGKRKALPKGTNVQVGMIVKRGGKLEEWARKAALEFAAKYPNAFHRFPKQEGKLSPAYEKMATGAKSAAERAALQKLCAKFGADIKDAKQVARALAKQAAEMRSLSGILASVK